MRILVIAFLFLLFLALAVFADAYENEFSWEDLKGDVVLTRHTTAKELENMGLSTIDTSLKGAGGKSLALFYNMQDEEEAAAFAKQLGATVFIGSADAVFSRTDYTPFLDCDEHRPSGICQGFLTFVVVEGSVSFPNKAESYVTFEHQGSTVRMSETLSNTMLMKLFFKPEDVKVFELIHDDQKIKVYRIPEERQSFFGRLIRFFKHLLGR